MDLRNRRRLQAGLIAAVFVVPVAIMLGLALAGWVPHGKSYGARVQPERDFAHVPVQRADGQAFAWTNRDSVWTMVALPGPDCATRCLRQLDLVHRAQISLDKSAAKLRLLYLGTSPAGVDAAGFDKVWMLASASSPEFAGLRPAAADSVAVVLVTPTGMALTYYAAGFNPEGLRQDLKKAVR
ncbi:MAG TPA: hypothetical protein VFQ95_07365 [Rhodanobacteraceae bacterium]|nr:hypothetical protein [Rhodanobacteraceae bacterium]